MQIPKQMEDSVVILCQAANPTLSAIFLGGKNNVDSKSSDLEISVF
jgi:hypothetical protein